jgi:hypothetical protein
VRVKNLGVVATGTRAQTCFLEKFGKSASTKHAILQWSESSDLWDLVDEEAKLWSARSGMREDRSLEHYPRQTSFLKALYKMLKPGERKMPGYNAYWEADGRSMPVRLKYTPPGSAGLTSGVKALLVDALRDWAATARRLHLKPWFLFMPTKERVFYGHVKWMDKAEPRFLTWKPTDLPELLRAICKDLDIPFIDPTSEMCAAMDQGGVTYFPWDCHLNPHGCACVARVIAEALRKEYPSSPTK